MLHAAPTTFAGSAETALMLRGTIASQVLRAESRTVEHFHGHAPQASPDSHTSGTAERGSYRLSFRLATGRLIRVEIFVHPIAPSQPVMFADLSGYIRWLHHRRLLKLTLTHH